MQVVEVVTLNIDGAIVEVERLEDGTFRKPAYLAGAEREVVGQKSKSTSNSMDNPAKQREHGYRPEWHNERLESPFVTWDITAPATPDARTWHGWGTALKPAWEPIVLAMKPLDGTFADNALAWGCAGLNVDGARIAATDKAKFPAGVVSKTENTFGNGKGLYEGRPRPDDANPAGRWPANLLLDEEAAAGAEWARYFYVAKASRRERDFGLDDMEPTTVYSGNLGGRDKKNPGKRHDPNGEWDEFSSRLMARDARNHHPTVKPLELMRYLVRLTSTPTGGVVLDPFMGSGTTGVACMMEGRAFVGIEKEAEYVEIARRRIAAAELSLLREAAD